jgi:AcrR family transcriptional regulator
MSQPRLAAKERSRDIVRATIDLFARRGSEGATTRDIAGAAGVSEALVFKHFPTKDSLYRAVLLSKIEEAERFLPLDGSLDELDDERFFLKIATAFVVRSRRDDSFLRLLLHSALEGHSLARQFYKARSERLLEQIERRIERMSRETARRDSVDPKLAARSFFALAFGVVVSRNLFLDGTLKSADSKRVARHIVSVFLDGVRADSPASPARKRS